MEWVLVTGSCGFLGSHLSEALLKKGYGVIGIDNFSTGLERNLTYLQKYPHFQFFRHDLVDPLPPLPSLSWILHFASPASPPKYSALPIETLRVNSIGTDRLLELALRNKGCKFFLASTSEVYGDPEVHPQGEEYVGHVNPVGVRSVYDEGKRYAESLTMAFYRKYGISVRIGRIFNTYGPRMDPEDGRVISNFIVQSLRGEPITIYGDGTQTRSFIYVDDLIKGVLSLMEVEYCSPVNLGNPEEYRILDLAQLIRDLVRSSSPLIFKPLPEDDPKRRCPDIRLAKKLFSFRPETPLREGLKKTIDYFREIVFL